MDFFIKFFGGEEFQGDGGFLECAVILEGFLGDLCRVVVADVRVERGDQHQRVVEVFLDIGFVGFDANGAVVVERAAGVGDEADGLQKVVDHHRLEHVELEVARGAADVDGGVVADHLRGHHGHGF